MTLCQTKYLTNASPGSSSLSTGCSCLFSGGRGSRLRSMNRLFGTRSNCSRVLTKSSIQPVRVTCSSSPYPLWRCLHQGSFVVGSSVIATLAGPCHHLETGKRSWSRCDRPSKRFLTVCTVKSVCCCLSHCHVSNHSCIPKVSFIM